VSSARKLSWPSALGEPAAPVEFTAVGEEAQLFERQPPAAELGAEFDLVDLGLAEEQLFAGRPGGRSGDR